jgi:hypothetical protein
LHRGEVTPASLSGEGMSAYQISLPREVILIWNFAESGGGSIWNLFIYKCIFVFINFLQTILDRLRKNGVQ